MRRRATTSDSNRGFTLIELLIVVAIIGVLAAIAIPNYVEAQTRAKTARSRADLRSIALALEAYAIQTQQYPPNDGQFNVVPIELTTPVAYLASARLADPFAVGVIESLSRQGAVSMFYTYMKIVTLRESSASLKIGRPCPAEAIDHPMRNPGALERYGRWRLAGKGPDRVYMDLSFPYPLRGSDIPYDPTNGTVSFGNILRTQKQ